MPGGKSFSTTSEALPQNRGEKCRLEDRLKKGYPVEELSDGVYWVRSGGYDCIFIRAGSGIIAVDPLPALAENLLAAIEDVTDEPVTHTIYNRLALRHSTAPSQPKISPAQPNCAGATRRLAPIQRCLMKSPVCSSAIAWRSCSCVFITMGPYHATGSSIGLPDTSRNRIPCAPACTTISSPRSKSTSE